VFQDLEPIEPVEFHSLIWLLSGNYSVFICFQRRR